MSGAKGSVAMTVLLLSILLGLFVSTLLSQTETETPTPEVPSAFARVQRVQSKPMPLSWKIAIAATAFVVGASALLFSMRAWRSSNLFDREYRFHEVTNVALRLGAKKSGGCMATIDFNEREGPRDSSPENL
jgi:hypothetical protein